MMPVGVRGVSEMSVGEVEISASVLRLYFE